VRVVAELAARQHGVLALRQLRELGLTDGTIDGWLRAGRLHGLHRGVYALGHTRVSARGHELAAVLACGPGALLSHRSAAVLWAIRRSTTLTEVIAPRSVGRRPGIRVHRSRLITPADRATIDGIPVTSPARTLVDLADVLIEQRLADAVHEAEVQRILDLRKVEQALERLPGRRGAHRLRRVLAAYGSGPPMTRNDAERAFLLLCQDHAIPTPRSNVLVGGFEVDFFWPGAELVVELDGGATHQTHRAFREDRRRDRELAVRGIQVLRVTWWDLVDDAAGVAETVRQVLLARC
jgi:very-short-patch-repair endonuclease